MNKWLIIPAIMVITLTIWTATAQITRDTLLNETQAISRVKTFYNGEVRSVLKQDAQYFIVFATPSAIYEVAVDEENGRFSKLHLIQKLANTQSPPAPEPSPLITAAQAQAIALQAYMGELEETTFYSTADGGYYLVEVEAADEDVMLQIHAVTGKILSVSFDD